MPHYDALVIGSGQAGTPLAKKLAQAGRKTALIEKRWVGGTCVNDGCTPTKTLIASARAAYMARSQSAELGVIIDQFHLDFGRVMQRQKDLVQKFRTGSQEGLAATEHLDLIFGEAVFTGPKKITVALNDGGHTEITADLIFIDTGTKLKIPDLAGLKQVPYLTSTTILELTELPPKLLILGGGYIGLEYGQMFCRFGSEVTILGMGRQFLKKEDPEVAAEIKNILTAEGLKILSSAKALKFSPGPGTEFTLTYKISNEPEQTLTFTHLLLATGRTPQSPALHPEVAGLAINKKGYIKVNDRLETNVPGIFALGEANGGPAFTHIAYNDYVIVARNILEQARLSTQNRPLPYCMFTDPQLGRVGLTEQQAREQGYNVIIATLPMQRVARALETGETRGFMKAVLDADTKKILGVAILNAEGGEVMTVLQLAMQAGLTYEELKDTVFAHPTYAEAINNLFLSLKE